MPAELTTDLNRAAEFLRRGELVAFATETVYGLGANALDVRAVARVFAAKQRPFFDPLIVHLSSADELNTVVEDVPKIARQLIDQFWPGPLTLVLTKKEIVPDLVTAGLPGVAVRVPDHPQARELIRRSGVPVAAPSANPFGRISPTTAEHVLQHLGNEIDLVLDGGPCRIGVESTVLQIIPEGAPVLLRPGGLTREAIEAEIGPICLPEGSRNESESQTAPGQLPKHYAPQKKLIVAEDWRHIPAGSCVGVLALTFLCREASERFGHIETLSATGDLNEAASNFFAALRRLDDNQKIEVIYATPFPAHGLGLALNDRLARAAR